MLSKDDIKTLRIYHKGFKAAEAAHGKDEAMKWHAINAACKVVSGQDKLHNIPANQGSTVTSTGGTIPVDSRAGRTT
jgi:hypothetical protein